MLALAQGASSAIRSITEQIRIIELLMLHVHHYPFCYQAFRASPEKEATHLLSSKGDDCVEHPLLGLKALVMKASCTDGEAFFVSFFVPT